MVGASSAALRQVADSVRPFMTAEKVRVGYVYGGDETNPERQAAPLVQGVDLLVAIPGKLLDFLECKVCVFMEYFSSQ